MLPLSLPSWSWAVAASPCLLPICVTFKYLPRLVCHHAVVCGFIPCHQNDTARKMRRAHAEDDFFDDVPATIWIHDATGGEREREAVFGIQIYTTLLQQQKRDWRQPHITHFDIMRWEMSCCCLRWGIGVKKGKKARQAKKWKKHKSWGEDPNTEEMWKRMWEEWDRFSLSVGCFTRAVCESESICIENNPLFIIYNSNRLKSFAVPFSLFSFTARCCSLGFLPFLSWSTRPNLGVWAQRELTERHIFQRTSSDRHLCALLCVI